MFLFSAFLCFCSFLFSGVGAGEGGVILMFSRWVSSSERETKRRGDVDLSSHTVDLTTLFCKKIMHLDWFCILKKGSFKFFYLKLRTRFSSHLDASPPPAEGLGADVGGHEVAVAHPPRPAEEVGQAVSHAGRRVAGSLLCCNAASGEQTGG